MGVFECARGVRKVIGLLDEGGQGGTGECRVVVNSKAHETTSMVTTTVHVVNKEDVGEMMLLPLLLACVIRACLDLPAE